MPRIYKKWDNIPRLAGVHRQSHVIKDRPNPGTQAQRLRGTKKVTSGVNHQCTAKIGIIKVHETAICGLKCSTKSYFNLPCRTIVQDFHNVPAGTLLQFVGRSLAQPTVHMLQAPRLPSEPIPRNVPAGTFFLVAVGPDTDLSLALPINSQSQAVFLQEHIAIFKKSGKWCPTRVQSRPYIMRAGPEPDAP
jgi:hypothetical protein